MSVGAPVEFWNDRYGEDGYAYGTRPSRLLLGWRDLLPAGGRALVPGAGQGRDAVFLAQSGLDVLAVDLSPVGLAVAERLARAADVTLETRVVDLLDWDWPQGAYDVIAAMFLHMPSAHRTPLHHRMIDALRPGGLIFLEGFTTEQIDFQQDYNSGGPPNVDMLFEPEDVLEDFDGMEPVAIWGGTEHLTEGQYHQGPAALLRAIFRKA